MQSSASGKRIGLALSGGGFRATLFHLGVVRFLRDAGLLPSISHITAVSGGSVLAAHLALHWDQYNGSPDDFESAAHEIIRFVQLDVRNRIVRRLPLGLPVHALRWLVRLQPARGLTRSGMLERYYESELFGQRCLYELPESPELHLLATNLGEGALCSFTRDGVIMQKRLPGQLFHFEHVHSGLGAIALAVAASSAFPGFFPPLLVHGQRIGAVESQFRNQLFTDGGVFDNLGVRMFRNIERTWLGTRLLQADDFYDADCVLKTLESGGDDVDAITKRVRDLYRRATGGENHGNGNGSVHAVVSGLQQLMVKEQLYQDDVLGTLKPDDAEAETLLKAVQTTGQELQPRDRIWLNRQILETALHHATGGRCMKPHSSMFDAVLVSDAGKQFEAAAQARLQGLVTTALRASDILMDRVWQLESEAFTKQPGFVFVSTNSIIPTKQDPHALHPEIQRQVAGIRTDLDRFTPLEISSLIQHGYCVARSRCLESSILRSDNIPLGVPWNPISPSGRKKEARWRKPVDASKGATTTTITARLLEQSKRRRIWSRLLDPRDWVSYVYFPLLIGLLLVGPLLLAHLVQLHRTNNQQRMLMQAIAAGSEDYQTVSWLLENEVPSSPADGYQVADQFSPVNYDGYKLISETQVYDQRSNERKNDDSSPWRYYTNRRYRVARLTSDKPLRLQFRVDGENPRVHCSSTIAPAKFTRLKAAHAGWTYWELAVDMTNVAIETPIDIVVETESFKRRIASDQQDWMLAIMPPAQFGIISMWVLLPPDAHFAGFDLYEKSAPATTAMQRIQPSTGNTQSSGSVIAWSLVNPIANHVYECRWVQTRKQRLRDTLWLRL